MASDLLDDKYNELLVDGKQFIQTTVKNKYCHENETCWEDIVTGRFRTELLKHFNESDASRILDMLLARRYITAGSITSSYGLDVRSTLSNCYYVPIKSDSIEGIYDCCKEIARVFSLRGGCGLDISILRPTGSKVNNSAKTSTGAVSFMPTFSNVSYTIGQCIEENQLVLMDSGLKKIKDIDPEKDKVWTRIGFVKVIRKIHSGKKQIYMLKTKFGNTIKASKDHIFLSIDTDDNIITSKLEDFQNGDSIIIIPGPKENDCVIKNDVILENIPYILNNYNNSNRLNTNIHFPTKLDEDLAYLLGFMYGNGYVEYYTKSNNPKLIDIAVNKDYTNVKEKICKLIKKYFNYDPKISDGDGHVERIRLHSVLLCNWLNENKLLKQKSNNIIVPDKILEADKNIQMSFYCGFFDADGTATNHKKSGYKCVSTSRKFIDYLQLILLHNGVLSKIHEDHPKNLNWKTKHELVVVGSYSKKLLVEKAKKSVKIQTNNTEISEKECYKVPITAKQLGVNYRKYGASPGLLSLSKFAVINEKENLNLNPLIIDYVDEITECGEAETYDLTLAEEHLFWCQGFYTHNSGRRGKAITPITKQLVI